MLLPPPSKRQWQCTNAGCGIGSIHRHRAKASWGHALAGAKSAVVRLLESCTMNGPRRLCPCMRQLHAGRLGRQILLCAARPEACRGALASEPRRPDQRCRFAVPRGRNDLRNECTATPCRATGLFLAFLATLCRRSSLRVRASDGHTARIGVFTRRWGSCPARASWWRIPPGFSAHSAPAPAHPRHLAHVNGGNTACAQHKILLKPRSSMRCTSSYLRRCQIKRTKMHFRLAMRHMGAVVLKLA